MGRTVGRLAHASNDLQVAGGIDRASDDAADVAEYDQITAPEDAADVLGSADVLIDFSAPGALTNLLQQHPNALDGRALVVGTTGLDDAQQAALDAAAERSAVLTAANFSIGVNLLLALSEQAARV